MVMTLSFWADFFTDPALLTIFMVFIIPIVWIVAHYWRNAETKRSLNALKRTMVERGMSADEIERVLAGGDDHQESRVEASEEIAAELEGLGEAIADAAEDIADAVGKDHRAGFCECEVGESVKGQRRPCG